MNDRRLLSFGVEFGFEFGVKDPLEPPEYLNRAFLHKLTNLAYSHTEKPFPQGCIQSIPEL
jgi:hypothetical protein